MKIKTINGFDDFCTEIKKIGFCLSGSSGDGIFSLEDYYSDNIEYHTGSNDFDPWRWRIRAIKETDTISYGKVFLNKAGWITTEWLSDFIAVRRHGNSFDELYQDGLMTQMEKQVFTLIKNQVKVSVSELNLEFGQSHKKLVAKALTNLQMKLLITICDETYKLSKSGEPYGWPVTVFCTIEEKYGQNITDKAYDMDPDAAYKRIEEHIRKQTPNAPEKKVIKLINKL